MQTPSVNQALNVGTCSYQYICKPVHMQRGACQSRGCAAAARLLGLGQARGERSKVALLRILPRVVQAALQEEVHLVAALVLLGQPARERAADVLAELGVAHLGARKAVDVEVLRQVALIVQRKERGVDLFPRQVACRARARAAGVRCRLCPRSLKLPVNPVGNGRA